MYLAAVSAMHDSVGAGEVRRLPTSLTKMPTRFIPSVIGAPILVSSVDFPFQSPAAGISPHDSILTVAFAAPMGVVIAAHPFA